MRIPLAVFMVSLAIQPVLFAAEANTALVAEAGADTQFRSGPSKWKPLRAGTPVEIETSIKTGKEGAKLEFHEGSSVKMGPDTEIKIEAVRNAGGGTLIDVLLEKGKVHARVGPDTLAEQSFVIHTAAAAAIPEGPAFSMQHDTKGKLTTLVVEEGTLMIQPESEVQSIYLHAGEQVSLNLSTMGPLVVPGSPTTLEEAKFPVALVDLGQMQVCENEEGQAEKCGTWTWDRINRIFNAEWQDGSKSVLKIEKMAQGQIILNREDPGGLTAKYISLNTGTEIEGDVGVQVLDGTVTWTQNGGSREGKWRARSHSFLDLNP